MSQPIKSKPPASAYSSPPGGGDQTRNANEVIKPESSNAQSASLSQLFSQAETIDAVYMVLGSIGSMVTGVSLPIFNILFGQMLDSLNKKGVSGYQDAVNQVCISFVIVAAANVVAGAMQVTSYPILSYSPSSFQHFFSSYPIPLLYPLLYFFTHFLLTPSHPYPTRYIFGVQQVNVKHNDFVKNMFVLYYHKKLDGLIPVVRVS